MTLSMLHLGKQLEFNICRKVFLFSLVLSVVGCTAWHPKCVCEPILEATPKNNSIKKPEDSVVDSCSVAKPKIIYQPINVAGKIVLGAVEEVYFENLDIYMAARIDTGATTSSIGVADIERLERDGKQWVRFKIIGAEHGSTLVEKQVVRNALVQTQGLPAHYRIVVSFNIIIGQLKQKAEFTIADRSGHEYPVLIGRNVLGGNAIVDVSHKYLISKKHRMSVKGYE